MHDLILHAFNWHYTDIASNAKEIADLGYGAVLFPPPLYSDPDKAIWWQRYQPKDYRIIRSFLGGKRELKEAIDALHACGVRTYADVVFNHMANEKTRPDPYNFPGQAELERYAAEPDSFEADRLYGDLSVGLFSHQDFNPEGDIANWNDRHESEERWLMGLPDLDLNDWVVEQQRTCLRALNALGFDGYRIDAIKHLPLAHIHRVFHTPEVEDKHVFAEALTANDHEEGIFLWPLLEQTHLDFYDFPLHETLRRAFGLGGSLRELVDPSANRQALPWDRAVTFSITHDMPNNDGFRWQMLDRQDEFLANLYLICRDGGAPLIFSDHNESADQYPADRDRWSQAWRRADIVGMIAFHNALFGQPQRSLFEDDGFLVFARGSTGIAAINKTANPRQPIISTQGLRQGRYRCAIHGTEFDVQGERIALPIAPRQGNAWLAQD